MKTTAAAIITLAGAAFVAAADFPPNMPECGRVCGQNMFAQAHDLGCPGGEVDCLCRNPNFGFGIHDCSVQACSDIDQANVVISWGNNLCSNAGVTTAHIPSATANGAGGATSGPVSTSEVVTTVTSDGSTFVTTSVTTIASESVTPTPVTTSTWTSVITSDSVTTTVTGETTISGISGIAGATSIPETTVISPIVSTQTSGSSTFETTVGSTTIVSSITGDALSSALSSQASEAPTSTSSGQAAQMTAAPALGVLAAAGIAVALL